MMKKVLLSIVATIVLYSAAGCATYSGRFVGKEGVISKNTSFPFGIGSGPVHCIRTEKKMKCKTVTVD